jgi:hypothetical protein
MSEDHIIPSPVTLVIYHQLHCSSHFRFFISQESFQV